MYCCIDSTPCFCSVVAMLIHDKFPARSENSEKFVYVCG